MKRAGYVLNTNICPHFAMARVDLFNVIKVRKLRTFGEVMATIGIDKNAIGCEICKPAIGSILSSLYVVSISLLSLVILWLLRFTLWFPGYRYNEPIMKPEHHQNQDTNDRFMANIQRNGTFSVVPRIAAGEITPEGLIAIGQVAKKYNLYTKVLLNFYLLCLWHILLVLDIHLRLLDYGWTTDRHVRRDEG